MLKVYRLNEEDFVAAESQEKAISWYMEETGLPREEAINEHYLSESDLEKDGVFFEIGEVASDDVMKAIKEGIWKRGRKKWFHTKLGLGYLKKEIDGKRHAFDWIPNEITHVWVPYKRALELAKDVGNVFLIRTCDY